jgi:hypothetical protein
MVFLLNKYRKNKKTPHIVRFLKNSFFYYFTFVESFTVSVASGVAHFVAHSVAFEDAFSVAFFSLQDVIREIVAKKDNEIKNNFFMFNREIKVYLFIYSI